jgi:hypothetical protein
VHRIKMPDTNCNETAGNIAWIDLTGNGNPGGIGASTLNYWLAHGYPGSVEINPHDCNPADGTPAPEDCGARTGQVSSAEQQGLSPITCLWSIPATQCPVIFPIVVVHVIQDPGSTGHYYQEAFVYVVLRGYMIASNNGNAGTGSSAEFDFEFVNAEPTNVVVGATNPNPNLPTMTGVQFCGVNADPSGGDHCPF